MRVDGVLKGDLRPIVEIRLETDSVPMLNPERSYLVLASADNRGTAVVGPCHTVQLVTSREEALQLLSLAVQPEDRSGFEHLPSIEPVTLSDLIAGADTTELTPSPATGQTVVPLSGLVSSGFAIVLIAIAIACVVWAIRTRRWFPIWPATFAAGGLLLVVVVARPLWAWPPAVEPAASPHGSPSASASPSLPDDQPTRDPITLAERFETFGMQCSFEENPLDNWRAWNCRDRLAADLWLELGFWANTRPDEITSFSVSVSHSDGVQLDTPIDPGTYGPSLRQVLEGPTLEQVGSWLESHWAIDSVSIDVSGIVLSKGTSGIGLDLRFERDV